MAQCTGLLRRLLTAKENNQHSAQQKSRFWYWASLQRGTGPMTNCEHVLRRSKVRIPLGKMDLCCLLSPVSWNARESKRSLFLQASSQLHINSLWSVSHRNWGQKATFWSIHLLAPRQASSVCHPWVKFLYCVLNTCFVDPTTTFTLY